MTDGLLEAVAAAAVALDERRPGWADVIDLSVLDLREGLRDGYASDDFVDADGVTVPRERRPACILCQLDSTAESPTDEQSWAWTKRRLFGDRFEVSEHDDAFWINPDPWAEMRFPPDELDRAWALEVLARRERREADGQAWWEQAFQSAEVNG